MLEFIGINWLAVVVVIVLHQILGFLWYGPLFGDRWLTAMGKSKEELGSPPLAISVGAVASAVMAFALALILNAANVADWVTGFDFGLIAGIGFVAAAATTSSVFEGTNRTVLSIGLGYQVLGLAIMGLVLGGWSSWGLPMLG